eukprot:gene17149-biopygen788
MRARAVFGTDDAAPVRSAPAPRPCLPNLGGDSIPNTLLYAARARSAPAVVSPSGARCTVARASRRPGTVLRVRAGRVSILQGRGSLARGGRSRQPDALPGSSCGVDVMIKMPDNILRAGGASAALRALPSPSGARKSSIRVWNRFWERTVCSIKEIFPMTPSPDPLR